MSHEWWITEGSGRPDGPFTYRDAARRARTLRLAGSTVSGPNKGRRCRTACRSCQAGRHQQCSAFGECGCYCYADWTRAAQKELQ